jgi:glycosyltransferase involved in cell wall biosynthesis
MSMFIDALKEFGELDLLFYMPENFQTDEGWIKRSEYALASHWGAQIHLNVRNMLSPQTGKSLWEEYGRRAGSLFRQGDYARVSGPQQINAFLNCLKRSPDAIFVHRLRSMCPLLLTKKLTAPVFLDLDDIEHVAFARDIKQPPFWRSKYLSFLLVPALLWGEGRAIKRATRTFVCSDHDRRYLSRLWRSQKITAIPNAVPIPGHTSIPEAQNLLFIGRYSYKPNAMGAEYLIQKIWPKVKAECKNARLTIAGEAPHLIASYGNCPKDIEFTGFVENLDELYRNTRVVCCPIRSGSGTRMKIVEAAAYGRPVVSTRMGAEGLPMKEGESIVIRESPGALAEACVALLRDAKLAARIGERARDEAIRSYDKKSVVQQIKKEIAAFI